MTSVTDMRVRVQKMNGDASPLRNIAKTDGTVAGLVLRPCFTVLLCMSYGQIRMSARSTSHLVTGSSAVSPSSGPRDILLSPEQVPVELDIQKPQGRFFSRAIS